MIPDTKASPPPWSAPIGPRKFNKVSKPLYATALLATFYEIAFRSVAGRDGHEHHQ
ncbi:hypothetical protein MPL1032_60173 [Mesorhizobium plurifarium]|uniref:Uncharacterized protein n=1 Tax=Mesorhizobium plurifarium TaxID=69974 RepID=A0A0K2W6A2_MESPL|nr:hypothetical protein MPL1032_60173 [Mesorhizobium plurifarium]